MPRRYQVLIGIALAILILDQWTKFLAVRHLTPGVAEAHAKKTGERIRSFDQIPILLDDVGFFSQLATFYVDVRQPCDARRTLCPEVKVIDGFWSWRYAENKGAAWSMFARTGDWFRRPFLVGVSSLAVLFIFFFVRSLDESQKMILIALSLICGGAIGNLIDRAYLGYVIDFIHWYQGTAAWPTFNLADSAISTGVGLIALNMLLDAIRGRKQQAVQGGVAER